jgi:hypothetical protein
MVFCLIYLSGYILIRQTRQEIWERDGKTYVIFPDNKVFYYLYRPLSITVGKLTGIGSHIGEHK